MILKLYIYKISANIVTAMSILKFQNFTIPRLCLFSEFELKEIISNNQWNDQCTVSNLYKLIMF